MCGRSLQGTLCVVFLALSLDQCATSSVVSIDMYRAMRSIDVDSHVLNSNNLADLGGVIQFLHTYIIVESDLTVQQQGGVRRKYDMDVITKRRFKIRNSQNLLDSHWRREQDFGPYMVFDYGQAADTELYGIFKEFGPWVGALGLRDLRVNSKEPAHWFSVSGGCPNLPFDANSPTDICSEQFMDGCPAKCVVSGVEDCSEYNDQCLKDESGQFVVGGLCRGGGGDPHGVECSEDGADCRNTLCCRNFGSFCFEKDEHKAVCMSTCEAGHIDEDEELEYQTPWSCALISGPSLPSGHSGCVFSYGDAEKLMIDDVVGITNVDCGGRNCVDWKDFRDHCTVNEYKQKFDSAGNVVRVSHCVEYDIHPQCAIRCDKMSPEDEEGAICADLRHQALTDRSVVIELGLPFWRGRCDQHMNRMRMEEVAKEVGIVGAGTRHEVVDEAILGLNPPCVTEGLRECVPDVTTGDFYCDRAFNGVCAECYIPGTVKSAGYIFGVRHRCSLSVLKSVDYSLVQYKPECKTSVPTDQCCLYTGECEGLSDPSAAALDDEGLALVAARMNSDDLYVFLTRAAEHHGYHGVKDTEALRKAAYNEWDRQPTQKTLKAVLDDVHNLLFPPTPKPKPIHQIVKDHPHHFLAGFVLFVLLILVGIIVTYLRSRQQDKIQRANAANHVTVA